MNQENLMNHFFENIQKNIVKIPENLKQNYINSEVNKLLNKIDTNEIRTILNYFFEIKKVAGEYSLRQSIAIISQCKSSIATDSGLGHISSNLGIPTVSLFGAGDSELTKPIGGNTFVLNQNVYCSPCLKNKCNNKKDPLLCLEKIQPGAILKSLDSI